MKTIIMKRLLYVNVCLFIFLVFFYLFNFKTSKAHIYKTADQSTPTFEEMINDLAEVNVVFVGETHDNANHHKAQIQIINALKKKKTKIAIGLEMFRSDSQEYLDDWIAGNLSLHEFMSVFNNNWSDWDLYRDIFHTALMNKIPLLGLNVQRSVVKRVASSGFSSLSKAQLESLPVVTCNVDRYYEEFIRRALGSHIDTSVPFQYFCEAQLLWDKVMAANLLKFLENNPDYTVIVLAGSGHSWKYGIPSQIHKKYEYSLRVVLPEQPYRLEKHSITNKDADYLLLGVDEPPLH